MAPDWNGSTIVLIRIDEKTVFAIDAAELMMSVVKITTY
jgi:hypothetical protein